MICSVFHGFPYLLRTLYYWRYYTFVPPLGLGLWFRLALSHVFSWWIINKKGEGGYKIAIVPYYLGCTVLNINMLFAEWSITECDYFQILLLGILSSMKPTIYFQDIHAGDSHSPGFCKYIFPQLQTCTALVLSTDCTEALVHWI